MSTAQTPKEAPAPNTTHGQASQKGLSLWVWALIASIALNGLFIGLLLANGLHHHSSHGLAGTSAVGTPPGPNNGRPVRIKDNDPRSLLRILPRERRRELMETALANLNLDKDKHPRRMFKQMREAQHQARTLMQTDPLNFVAIETALTHVRTLNQEISINGDSLYVEILKNLTLEERIAVQKSLRERGDKRMDRRKRRNDTRKKPQ